jgi:hypothetical protein
LHGLGSCLQKVDPKTPQKTPFPFVFKGLRLGQE